jgi:hypothetical protein
MAGYSFLVLGGDEWLVVVGRNKLYLLDFVVLRKMDGGNEKVDTHSRRPAWFFPPPQKKKKESSKKKKTKQAVIKR